MKSSRLLNFLLVFTICFLPSIYLVSGADNKEWYVGINEKDTYIYLVTWDGDPYADFLETLGFFSEETIDAYIDSMDLDYEAYKIYILEIKEEDEYSSYEGVQYYYNTYISEDRAANDWELQGHNKRAIIFKYTDQRQLYKNLVDDWEWTAMGLTPFFIGNDVDWKELANEVNDKFENRYSDRDGGAKRINNGIFTFCKPDTLNKTNLEKFRSKSIYSSQGVLTYYEWSYDGDIIMKFELEMALFVEYWLIILIIAGVAVVIVIIAIKKSKTL